MEKKKPILILAIETSCDETSAAVICVGNKKPKILSNIVSSQVDLHTITGGIVPEVASRAHMEAIVPVINEALIEASLNTTDTNLFHKSTQIHKSKNPKSEIRKATSYKLRPDLLSQITHIAVTSGPGLIGSLLVGFNAAKSIAYARDLPIIPINHIEGHIYSALLSKTQNSKLKTQNDRIDFPILVLTVSGGHTALTMIFDHGKYETMGQTRDDAAGEAFDKVAQLLGLGFPGGPAISKLAEQFRNRSSKLQDTSNKQIINSKFQKSESKNLTSYKLQPNKLVFPRPMINERNFDFSFSGLKTAVLTEVKKRGELSAVDKEEIASAFEDAAVDLLVTKTIKAVKEYKPKAVLLAGGVAANRFLRNRLTEELKNLKTDKRIELKIAPLNLCGDNAAMIGLAAYYHIERGDVKHWDEIKVDSNFTL